MQRTFHDNAIVDEIFWEIKAQKANIFPDHPLAQAATVTMMANEVSAKSWQWKYNRSETIEDQKQQIKAMRQAAIETAASCLRFIENLPVI